MPWPPDIAEQLPAPRDDEPPGLRHDIADELADHLQSAFVRELHATRDEESAKGNVLERFGNPASIATKLWFDAMWEKIMSQRLTIVALVVVMLASLGSTGLTWFLFDRSLQVSHLLLEQSRTANAALLEQGRAANEVLLKQLGEIATATKDGNSAGPSLEWNQVKVRLFSGENSMKPAEDFKVKLRGFILDTAKEVSVTRTSDANGLADMGLIRPGQHQLTLIAPWGETRQEARLTVLPGKSLTEEIACPPSAPEFAEVDLSIDWPDDIKARDPWLVCHFVGEPRIVGGQPWEISSRDDEKVLVIDPAGKIASIPHDLDLGGISSRRSRDGRPLWLFQSRNMRQMLGPAADSPLTGIAFLDVSQLPSHAKPVDTASPAERRRNMRSGFYARYAFLINPPMSFSPHISIPSRGYRLDSVIVATAPQSLPEQEITRLSRGDFVNSIPAHEVGPALTGTRALPVLGGLIANWSVTGYNIRADYLPLADWQEGSLAHRGAARRAGERLKAQPRFSAQPGRPNRWTIELPAQLQNLIRANPALVDTVSDAATPSASAQSKKAED